MWLDLEQLRSPFARLRTTAAINLLSRTRDELELRIEHHRRNREDLVAQCFGEGCPTEEREALRRRITEIDRALDVDITALERLRDLSAANGIELAKLLQ